MPQAKHFGRSIAGIATNRGDLGMGNAPSSDTDWTFSNNAAAYTNKTLYVLVRNHPGPLPATPDVVERVSEAQGFELVYELDPTVVSDFDTGIPYTIDNASQYRRGGFDRVAYMMELNDDWVWVSFDCLNKDASDVGYSHQPCPHPTWPSFKYERLFQYRYFNRICH